MKLFDKVKCKGFYVPLEDIECENSDERNNNHD